MLTCVFAVEQSDRTAGPRLTTDLPASQRIAYVGNDQVAAGATAAYIMGRALGGAAGRVLLVYSAPYRVQEERELGFRRILRAEFPRLVIDERVNSNDESEYSYENVVRYLQDNGPPAGIYNVAAGNIGTGRALSEADLAGKVVFIGHELNANSRMLLESGQMDFVIGHDVEEEVRRAIGLIVDHLDNNSHPPAILTEVRVHTKFNC